MIHINSLMLGDLVSVDGKICKVIELGGMACVTPVNYEDELFCDSEDIEPIPLIPEILERNGFKECVWNGADSWSMGNYDTFICISGRNGGAMHLGYMGYDSKISLLYIHELQHALHLCGIDKEIEL